MALLLKDETFNHTLRSASILTPTLKVNLRTYNLHESFVVFVNFEDVEVVFGLDELLDGAVVGGDGHHAGQVLEAPLAVHPHLDVYQNRY